MTNLYCIDYVVRKGRESQTLREMIDVVHQKNRSFGLFNRVDDPRGWLKPVTRFPFTAIDPKSRRRFTALIYELPTLFKLRKAICHVITVWNALMKYKRYGYSSAWEALRCRYGRE